VVEATEGCDINLGKCAKRVKSTIFVKKILPTCITLLEISKLTKNSQKVSMIKILTENSNFLSLPRNFHAKRQGGEG
jgi:hypothetical protein